MSYRVLVVDDSSFFRRRVTEIINSDDNLTVIDVAVNGQDAVDKAKKLKPDVITMDIEMPVLNGIDAVKEIMASSPTSILMFSSLTHQGAKATLEALEAGALDFLPKKFNEIAKTTEDAGSLLRQRVLHLARKRSSLANKKTVTAPAPNRTSYTPRQPVQRDATVVTKSADNLQNTNSTLTKTDHKPSGKDYKLLAIGTSTGGPIALQKILMQMPANFPMPILLIQHMPAAFTRAFADRLNSLCKISVKEAEDGDVLKAGCAYLAPGGRQMLVEGKSRAAKLVIREDKSDRIAFKPSVDISFGTAAKVFGDSVLAVVLTGMGSDGKEGSRMLHAKGSTIWAQDEETSVVYGMPQAVASAGIASLSLPLQNVASAILREIENG